MTRVELAEIDRLYRFWKAHRYHLDQRVSDYISGLLLEKIYEGDLDPAKIKEAAALVVLAEAKMMAEN
jgi:hypothetical protein